MIVRNYFLCDVQNGYYRSWLARAASYSCQRFPLVFFLTCLCRNYIPPFVGICVMTCDMSDGAVSSTICDHFIFFFLVWRIYPLFLYSGCIYYVCFCTFYLVLYLPAIMRSSKQVSVGGPCCVCVSRYDLESGDLGGDYHGI